MTKPPNTAERRMYAEFAEQFGFCWATGERETVHRTLDIAHIVGGAGRRHDRRAIVRLAHDVHMASHGDRIRVGEELIPQLNIFNLCWLKERFDPECYDPDFIRSIRTKRAEQIIPVRPADWFAWCWARHPVRPMYISKWIDEVTR